MSQKKKKNPLPTPTCALTRSLPFFDVCILEFKSRESFPAVIFSSSSSPVKLWYCVCVCKPHTNFFSASSRDLIQESENLHTELLGLPECSAGPERWSGKMDTCVTHGVLLLILQLTRQPAPTKTSSSFCCTERGHIPSLRKDANMALFWNTASAVPCSGFAPAMGYFGDQFV